MARPPARSSPTPTRITELDPLEHGLLFERFLNPERINPPDVDLDFDDRQRDRMVRYVTEKYGDEYTAHGQHVRHDQGQGRRSRTRSRILGYPFAHGRADHQGDAAGRDGQGRPARRHLRRGPPALRRGRRDPGRCTRTTRTCKKVIDTGRGIEGLIRGTGVHAAAVILSEDPAHRPIPLHMRAKDGVNITGFDYPSCEDMGLVKMDFLGLRNLGVIDHAIKIIRENRGVETSTTRDASRSTTSQDLRAAGPRRHPRRVPARRRPACGTLLKLMEPTRFEDIAAVLALYRPGPDGRQRAHQLRAPQERPPGDRARSTRS